MAKNIWKQFEAWATDLRYNLIQIISLRLATVFSFALLGVLSLFVIYFRQTRLNETDIYIRDLGGGDLNQAVLNHPDLIKDIQFIHSLMDIGGNDLILLSLTILASFFIGFMIYSVILSPIKNIVMAQKRFIDDASHELRTPLSVMKTNMEISLMGHDKIDDKTAHNIIYSNIEEINKMSEIIKNLINISRIDKRDLEDLPFTKINIMDVINRIKEQSVKFANAKNIKINIEGGNAYLWANETALEEMFTNLINNSIKYTARNGEIKIDTKIDEENHTIKIHVRDTGIGIHKEDLPYIFDPFFKARADKNTSIKDTPNHINGSGLGLSIVKEIVKKHGGNIFVNSTPGQGTIFTIVFPAPLIGN